MYPRDPAIKSQVPLVLFHLVSVIFSQVRSNYCSVTVSLQFILSGLLLLLIKLAGLDLGDQGSNTHGRNFLFHVFNCEVLGSSPSFAPFFFCTLSRWARSPPGPLPLFQIRPDDFFSSVCDLVIYPVPAYFQNCHCFALLISKYACIQTKQTIYVKCIECHVLSQFASFIHV